MTKLLTVGLAFALLLGVACGGGAKPSEGTVSSATPGPPPLLVVSDSDSSLEAALGSYCWFFGDAGVCPHATALVTSRQPLVALGDRELSGSLPELKISEVLVQASPVAGSSSQLQRDGLIAWTRLSSSIELPATIVDGKLTIDISMLDGGQYVVAVSLRVKDEGDATYGFLLDKDVGG